MNPILLHTILAATGVGLAIAGYEAGRYASPRMDAPPELGLLLPAVTENNSDQTAQIALLLQKLAEADDKIAVLTRQIDHLLGTDLVQPEPPPVQQEAARTPLRNAEVGEGWMMTEDPERQAEMTARREEREERRREFIEQRHQSEVRRDDFFSSVNIAYMPDEEQQALAAFVADYRELRELFESRQDGESPDIERVAQLGRDIAQRVDGIRESLLRATAREMGFDEAESGPFAESINAIFGATSLMGPGGGAMPFGGSRNRRRNR